MKAIVGFWLLIVQVHTQTMYAQTVGQTLSPWKAGNLDIHHINTGRGNATFFILPDGTTLLVDAGALDPTAERTLSPRNTRAVPNADRQPGEWIARYITRFMTMSQLEPRLNYAQLTHFHNDHMGSPSSISPKAEQGNFVLTGITQVAAYLPIDKLIDRGWPEYAYPYPQHNSMMTNYRAFVDWQSKQKGTVFERSKPGRSDQITLLRNPAPYSNTFEIRNIIANGEVWTGSGTATRQLFPALAALNTSQLPSENMCSIAIRLRYGAFDYFSGGDLPGVVRFGSPAWNDVETPVSKVVGPVDVHILDHHGNRDSQNDNLLAALRPRVFVIPVWSSDHPGHDVLDRMYSQDIYPGERDVFATDMLEANKLVIGELLNRLKSDKGHIVVRVDPGGTSYQVMILEDSNENMAVKGVFGPYQSH